MSDPYASGRPPADPEPFDVTPPPLERRAWRETPAPGEEPARPSRRRLIVLGSLLAVGLAGAAALGTTGWRIVHQKDTTLATPTQVAGLTRDDSERARTTADYLQTAFAADINLDKSIGAVYSDPADAKRSVLIFGGTTLLWQPERDLDSLFGLVSDDAGKVDGLREVSAGDLGGVMKCGTTSGQDGDITVCGWADHGSVVIAMFPGRTVSEAATLLRSMRHAMQTRN